MNQVIDSIQSDDVKPDAEPDWESALVVRDRFGHYYGRADKGWYWLHRLAGPNPVPVVHDAGAVVIDADGRNVEAEDVPGEADGELADSKWWNVKLRMQVDELQAQLNEAIRAREIAQRDLRKLQRRTADLEADNARLQAQTGDGR